MLLCVRASRAFTVVCAWLLLCVSFALAGCFGSSSGDPGADASSDAAFAFGDSAVPDAHPDASTAGDASASLDAGPDGDGAPAGFAIGGKVTGLTGKGLVLRDDGADDLAVTADGAFTFKTRVAPGSAYAVTVAGQPTGPTQTCTVTGGSGTAHADVTDVAVACSTEAYAIGGTLVGLSSASTGGVELVDTIAGGATDTLTVDQNGSFTFAQKVPSGSTFAVAVKAGPTSPAQTCAVSGGSGTVVAGPVTSVVVNCATNAYVLGGTVSGLAGQGLVLQNGATTVAISSNGSFAFPAAIPSGTAYAVTVAAQPGGPSQTCTVTGGAGTVAGADVTSVAVACVTNTYTVGGNVAGLSGAGLVLRNGSETLAVGASGSFTFPTPVASGAQYGVTVAAQPTSPWQTCTVTGGAGIVGGANVTNVQVACVANTYPVHVTVAGLAGKGLVLTDEGGDALGVPASGAYTFATPLASGAFYAVQVSVQPATPTQVCTVAGGTGTVGGAPVDGVTVTCATSTYPVGGTLSGLTGTGLVLTDNGGDALPIAPGATTFTFKTGVASASAYDVEIGTQPSNPAQTCKVSGNKGTLVASGVTSVVVNCGTNTYTVGGTVTGVAGSGVVLQNGAATVTVSADGTFAFPAIASGSSYDVTVATQPASPSQVCTVTHPSGAVGAADVTDVQVACVTQSFTVGGTVSGLALGTSVVLEDNLADDLTVSAAGGFTFQTPVASGAGYAVTVKTQPTSPWQTCAPTGTTGSGTVGAGPVTDVAIACTPNPYQVSAAVSGLLGSGMTLALNGGTPTAVGKDGTYALGAKLASGTSYAVTVANQPTSPTQKCSVTAPGTVVGGADITVQVSCVTRAFPVGGTVSGLAGTGLQLTNTDDGDVVNIPAGATSFTFPNAVLSGQTFDASITGQPSNPTQACKITGQQGTVGGAAVGTIAVNCATQTYTIGGTITVVGGGALGANLALTNGNETIHPTSTGAFAFATPVASGASYAVQVTGQPTSPVQSCVATANTGTVGSGNVNTVQITCTTTTFKVHAAVTGLQANTSFVLQDNGGDDLTVSGNTTLTFATAVASGSGWSVGFKSQPANQSCTLSSPSSGTIGAADVTVSVTCSPILFTLTVQLKTLQSGGGNAAVDINTGIYPVTTGSVSVQIQQGQSWGVGMDTQPLGQTCKAETATTGTMTADTTVTFACNWMLQVTVVNGFALEQNPCPSVKLNLTEQGASIIQSHDTATATGGGTWQVDFPNFPTVPQGAFVQVDYAGPGPNDGFCTCTLDQNNINAQCANWGCPINIVTVKSATTWILPTVYCGIDPNVIQ